MRSGPGSTPAFTMTAPRHPSRSGSSAWPASPLPAPDLFAGVEMHADEIAALSPAAEDDASVDIPRRTDHAMTPRENRLPLAAPRTPASPAPRDVARPESTPAEQETPGAAEARERRSRQTMGLPEPKPRRRWRRSSMSSHAPTGACGARKGGLDPGGLRGPRRRERSVPLRSLSPSPTP